MLNDKERLRVHCEILLFLEIIDPHVNSKSCGVTTADGTTQEDVAADVLRALDEMVE